MWFNVRGKGGLGYLVNTTAGRSLEWSGLLLHANPTGHRIPALKTGVVHQQMKKLLKRAVRLRHRLAGHAEIRPCADLPQPVCQSHMQCKSSRAGEDEVRMDGWGSCGMGYYLHSYQRASEWERSMAPASFICCPNLSWQQLHAVLMLWLSQCMRWAQDFETWSPARVLNVRGNPCTARALHAHCAHTVRYF